MYNLYYFTNSSHGISGSDFERKDRMVITNLNHISTITELEVFTLPISGKPIKKFSIVTMSNGNNFYIREETYDQLLSILDLQKI